MKTEYKYGLGRDRRELSYYQSADWMDEIRSRRKSPGNHSKGEKHPRAILTAAFVLWLRALPELTYSRAKRIGTSVGVTGRHIIMIYRRQRWTHI